MTLMVSLIYLFSGIFKGSAATVDSLAANIGFLLILVLCSLIMICTTFRNALWGLWIAVIYCILFFAIIAVVILL